MYLVGFEIKLGVLFCFFKKDLELVAATRFFAHISYSALAFSVASPLERGRGDVDLAEVSGSRSSLSTFEPGGGMSFPTLLRTPTG